MITTTGGLDTRINIQQIIELESFRRIQALNSIADQYRIPDETVWEILGYGKLDD